jgi:hypothetical protein
VDGNRNEFFRWPESLFSISGFEEMKEGALGIG